MDINNGMKNNGILPILLSDDDDDDLHCCIILTVLLSPPFDSVWHVDDPSGAIGVLEGHDKQLALLVLPELGLYVLTGHGVQADNDPLPVLLLYVPVPHAMHDTWFV